MSLSPLGHGEAVISEIDDTLYRQATTPLWDADKEQPSSHSFGPSTADKGKPSFSWSRKVTAQESRDWHKTHASKPSHGVWGCSVGLVNESNSQAVDDSGAPLEEGRVRAPGHAYVDYRHLDKSERKHLRSLLLADALGRGEFPTH